MLKSFAGRAIAILLIVLAMGNFILLAYAAPSIKVSPTSFSVTIPAEPYARLGWDYQAADIYVTNNGDKVLENIKISASGQWTKYLKIKFWPDTINKLLSGETTHFYVYVATNGVKTPAGTYSGKVTVKAKTGWFSSVSAEVSAQVTVPVIKSWFFNLKLDKTSVKVGQSFKATATVVNSGNVPLKSISAKIDPEPKLYTTGRNPQTRSEIPRAGQYSFSWTIKTDKIPVDAVGRSYSITVYVSTDQGTSQKTFRIMIRK